MMEVGDVVRTDRLRALLGRGPRTGWVDFRTVKGCQYVLLVLGIEGPDETISADRMLIEAGWTPPPDTDAAKLAAELRASKKTPTPTPKRKRAKK